MNEKNLETMQSNTEVYGQIDSLEDFEKIESPDELSEFMRTNIRYGFVSKDSEEIYASSKEIDEHWNEYYLQSPKELLESKHGVCWDSAELERHWFSNKDIEHKTFYLEYEGTELPTHTFLAFKKEGKWYWFEHSWSNYGGIHEYDNLEELLADVKQKNNEQAVKKDGATAEDLGRYFITEYNDPKFGSCPEEFVNDIKSKK